MNSPTVPMRDVRVDVPVLDRAERFVSTRDMFEAKQQNWTIVEPDAGDGTLPLRRWFHEEWGYCKYRVQVSR